MCLERAKYSAAPIGDTGARLDAGEDENGHILDVVLQELGRTVNPPLLAANLHHYSCILWESENNNFWEAVRA